MRGIYAMRQIFKKKRKLSSQTSLLITITIAVALTVSAFLFCVKTYRELTRNYQDLMIQESNATISDISRDINSIDSIYRLLVSNNSIYDFMESASTEPSDFIWAEKQMSSVLIINNSWEKNYLESVFVFTPSGKEFHIAKEDSSLTQLANTSVYKMLSAPSPTLSLYTLNQDGNLYFVRSIYNLTSGNVMGTMIVAVNEEKWSNSLTRNLTDGWRIFLFNDAFTLLSGSPDVTEPEIDALKSSLTDPNRKKLETIPLASENYLTLTNPIDLLDITATVMTPEAQLRSQVYNVMSSYILVIFLILLISVLCSFVISRFINRPIAVMIRKINAISQGDYSKKISGLEDYIEFCNLQTAINDMLDQIHSYHDNLLEQKLLLKDSEIKTLQSQLNPHFLFNVLNTLAWKAEMADNSEISNMVIAIGEILRSSTLYRTSNTISLEEELKFVHFYNYLQKMRFEDKIRVIETIDPNIGNYQIPCFCIQSLVENAYVHGLEPKPTDGTLEITVKKRKDCLSITVADDGVGFQKIPDFTEDESAQRPDTTPVSVLSDGSGQLHPHVGLKNLNRRLYLMYGRRSILRIQSIPNQKTTISFDLPLHLPTKENPS